MSGGVDSSVAAALLLEQGYDVMGLTMINWDPSVAEKAAQSAAALGIKHHIVNLRKEFNQLIIDYFAAAYQQGLTPNPCVECNKFIKFGLLLEAARNLGCDMAATGHYARIEYDSMLNRYLLKKGLDTSKDQSYFLYGLKQNQLAHALFPLGGLTKKEVRALARTMKIPAAEVGDSQEICFIDGDYRDFLKERIICEGGLVVNGESQVVGHHQGLPFYTIGQRRGLGISWSYPLYVLGLDMVNNRLLVGEENKLYRQNLTAANNNFIAIDNLTESIQVMAKIRYRAAVAPAVIIRAGDRVQVTFATPQRAITPGQSVVYYRGDCVVGGGVISAAG
jgi:tRNA-specific 2-thiouridylase